MSNTEARASHIVRWNAKKGATFVKALPLELDRDAAARFGTAFGILAADAESRTGEALAAHIEDAFVRGALEAVRKLPADAPQDQLFEAAVARVNLALGRLFGDYGLAADPERAVAAILCLRGHDVVAAVWNKPSMLLYHPLPDGKIKALDLIDDTKTEKEATFRTANVRRCFGSIIAGRMGKKDRLLVASHDLRAYLTDEQLEAALIGQSSTKAATAIQARLAPLHDSVAVASLVLEVAEKRYVEDDPTVARATQPVTTTSSIAKLIKTQSDTAEALSPTLVGGLGKAVAGILHREPAPTPDAPAATTAPAAPETPKERPTVMVVSLAKTAGGLLVGAAKGAWTLLVMLVSKEKRAAARAQARENVDRAMNGLIERFNALGAIGRSMLLVVACLAIFGKIGFVVAGWNRAQDDKIAANERAVAQVQQRIDSAEASLIYQDESRAKELLDEASSATDALPDKTASDLATKAVLRQKIAQAHESLRHAVTLAQPEIVASITDGSDQAQLARLAPADGGYWSADEKGGLFKVSGQGTAEKVGTVPGGATPAIFIAAGNGLFASDASGAGASVTSAGKQSSKSVDLGGDSVADAGLYNARLYVLDAAHNRIVRHLAASAGFGASESYLKDGTDLSNAVSMAIDGAVWVLKKDGGIIRIVKGAAEPFTVTTPDPPVTAPIRIRTDAEDDGLYVLDSNPARILRYSKKTGQFLSQYVSDSLAGATDFVVDAQSKTAVVAVKNQLLKFALPQ